ncbi:MAG: hypothetical protein LBG17_08335 [Bacteroidales bacterium]|jgi:hypothetical protein|nr:hypothetical protein [Bacteroidales bacterium]
MSNHPKFISLRRDYPKFIYESYAWKWVDIDGIAEKRTLRISFVFKVLDAGGNEAFVFEPSVLLSLPFDSPYSESEAHNNSQINTLAFNCGMIEMISCWKATCSPVTQVICGTLTDEQQAWWKRIYFNGLGEFFYVNGIDTDCEWFMRLQNIVQTGGKAINTEQGKAQNCTEYNIADKANEKILVPVGGGKDSCVTLELLKKIYRPRDREILVPFIINPRKATEKCCEKAGFAMSDVVVMYRTIDPLLLEMNRRGFLNGHTPFSAMLAFYSTVAATLAGAKYIVLSNESSANEATVTAGSAGGNGVNHQYSKSFEFETDFQLYAEKFLFHNNTTCPKYFSLLRPFSEAHIAKIFSQYPQYFDVFKSCNVGSKTDSWCGHCAKCLFVYIILAPFLPPETLRKIFNGKNLLDDISLQKEFDELAGAVNIKPFECVGTVDEINWALQQISEKHSGILLDHYKTLAVSKIPQLTEKIFALTPDHALPPLFEDFFKNNYYVGKGEDSCC